MSLKIQSQWISEIAAAIWSHHNPWEDSLPRTCNNLQYIFWSPLTCIISSCPLSSTIFIRFWENNCLFIECLHTLASRKKVWITS